MSDIDDKMLAASQEALNIRALALLDATKAVCGYCAKGESCGHEEIPFKLYGEWRHNFIVGNGSNPCSAGPIWDLIEDCLKRPAQYKQDWKYTRQAIGSPEQEIFMQSVMTEPPSVAYNACPRCGQSRNENGINWCYCQKGKS